MEIVHDTVCLQSFSLGYGYYDGDRFTIRCTTYRTMEIDAILSIYLLLQYSTCNASYACPTPQ